MGASEERETQLYSHLSVRGRPKSSAVYQIPG